jgi:hypothetical protein
MIKRPKLGVFVMTIISLTNCSPEKLYNDINLPVVLPGKEVLHAFSAKYPDADEIHWDMENEFYIARFMRMSVPVNAWFSKAGEWFLSEEEHSFGQIHSGIPEAFYRSSYSEWDIEKVILLERNSLDTVYIVSATRNNRFVNLHYSKYGDFIKARSNGNDDVYYPVVIPPEIKQALGRLFDSPEIIDYWEDELGVNVAIYDNGNYCLVVFTYAYEWLCTFRNIAKTDLSPKIWEMFQSSEYGVYTVNQFRILQNGTGISYVFYFLDEEKKSYILFIKENGNFDCVISY